MNILNHWHETLLPIIGNGRTQIGRAGTVCFQDYAGVTIAPRQPNKDLQKSDFFGLADFFRIPGTPSG